MAHSSEYTITKVAVIGTGVIGSSWTTLFLAKGYKVVVSDPAPGAAEKLSKYIKSEWPTIKQIGLAEGASPSNYEFVEDITKHLHDVDFVQEVSPRQPQRVRNVVLILVTRMPLNIPTSKPSS